MHGKAPGLFLCLDAESLAFMPDMAAPPGYTLTESGLALPTELRASHFGDVTNSQTPSSWLIDWAQGSRRTHAGLRVSPQSSMALSTYYACIRVISEDAGSLPLQVLERLERGRRKAVEHWLWPIVHDEFNPDMTAMTGREVLYHHALGWGNGYGLILRDRSMSRREGEVTGIYPLHPARVRPYRDKDTGELAYEIYQGYLPRDAPDIPEEVPAADMIHIKGLGPDGLVGYSLAQLAAESLGLSLAAQDYGASFFGNHGVPSGILKHPQKLSKEGQQLLKDSWQARGPNEVAVLEEGMTWEKVTIAPNDAQFLETRIFQVEEICRWFRVPLHMVQHLADAKYANIEQQAIDYVVGCLTPWLVRGEQELNRKLLKGTPYYVKHDVRGLLRGDQAARAEYYKALFAVGAYSPNDIREIEDFNPYDGGDEYFLQIQYAPVRKIADGSARQPRPAPRPLSPQDTTAHRNGFHHAPEEPARASE